MPNRKEYNRRYYIRTKDRYRQQRSITRNALKKKIRLLVLEAKSKPCFDCGIQYPSYVMDLDHKRDKKFNLSNAADFALKRVILEINKCEPVCANCHRERTHGSVTQR